MTIETSTNPQTVLAEWLVTFVMSKGGRRRVFIYTVPAISEQSALAAAYTLADVVHESSGGRWDGAREFTTAVGW
jgi:hypothetical protein